MAADGHGLVVEWVGKEVNNPIPIILAVTRPLSKNALIDVGVLEREGF